MFYQWSYAIIIILYQNPSHRQVKNFFEHVESIIGSEVLEVLERKYLRKYLISLSMQLLVLSYYCTNFLCMKRLINIQKQDCLLQGQAQMDQRVVFRFSTLRLMSEKQYP